MWTCKHCNNTFPFKRTTEKANHTRWCNSNPNVSASRSENRDRSKQRADQRFGLLKMFVVNCGTCGTTFSVQERENLFPSRESYYCSRSCANSVGGKTKAEIYHSDENAHYTTVCFRHHEKKCVICNEVNIVSVHHLDGNHSNNNPENLIPLCPTHHQYWHSKFRPLIEQVVMMYIEHWKEVKKGP